MGTVKINTGYTPEEMKNSKWFGSGGGGSPQGKTHEEIKKGLECCIGESGYHLCHECPYSSSGSYCMGSNEADALAYIQQLEAELDDEKNKNEILIFDNDKLMEEIAQTERERDELLKEGCSK